MVILTDYTYSREWETETHPFCLKPENPDRDVGELSTHYQKIGKMILDTWYGLHRYTL